MLSGATPSLRVRARCRAVGLRGFVYFVGTHTRSTVPLGRSAAALGAIIEGPQICVTSDVTRVGKGLNGSRDVKCQHKVRPKEECRKE